MAFAFLENPIQRAYDTIWGFFEGRRGVFVHNLTNVMCILRLFLISPVRVNFGMPNCHEVLLMRCLVHSPA